MAIDTNGDSKIDLHEAIDSMHMVQKNASTPQWVTGFDSNHDASLGTEEFEFDLNYDGDSQIANVSEYLLNFISFKKETALNYWAGCSRVHGY